MSDAIDAHSGGYETVYTITGSREFVEQTIAQITAQYHPLGYGTEFSKPMLQPDGVWLAFGSRANSCD